MEVLLELLGSDIDTVVVVAAAASPSLALGHMTAAAPVTSVEVPVDLVSGSSFALGAAQYFAYKENE